MRGFCGSGPVHGVRRGKGPGVQRRGRLVTMVAEKAVAVAVTGVFDIAGSPRRTRIQVELFGPLEGRRRSGESTIGLSRRVMAEIRDRARATRVG